MPERYRGCLLASAAGDALGGPLEFIGSREGLSRLGGSRGVRDYLPLPEARGRKGAITDDTQMTMATAEGLIQAAWGQASSGRGEAAGRPAGARDARGDDDRLLDAVYTAYLRWYDTQSISGLRRAPGNTCLASLASGRMGAPERPINDSKGSGGVMRVAPVGLAFPGEPDRAFAFGVRTAATTHGHPGGYLPAGFLAAVVARLVVGEPLEAAVRAELGRGELGSGLRRMLATSAELAAGSGASWDDFDRFGWRGFTGDEALAIALYAVLRHPASLPDALVTATFHTGDSDTTGAVAGAMAGAAHGEKAIPERWLLDLEHRVEITRLADLLYELYARPGSP